MRIGFIGVGTMGTPLVGHLVRAGFEVGVFARRPERLSTVVAAGAIARETIAALASASDIVITMVGATADVEEVVLGDEGVLSSAKPGTIVIDMTTIAPAATRRIAESLAQRGIEMLDAPVSGGPAGAESATLTIMVGGDAHVLEQARPVLQCFGTRILHLGPHGAGQMTKACNQLALLVAAEGVAEALALAAGSGLDPARVRETLLGGLAASRVLELFGERMVERRFQAGIPARLYHKDLGIVLQAARDAGVEMPAGGLVMEHLKKLMERGLGDADLAVLLTLVESDTQARHKHDTAR